MIGLVALWWHAVFVLSGFGVLRACLRVLKCYSFTWVGLGVMRVVAVACI